MNILGISAFYHDAAAALVSDGRLVAAAEEERFSRKKHDSDFPARAVRFCLDHAGLAIEDIDAVAFYEKPFLKLERVLFTHLAAFPRSFVPFLITMPLWLRRHLRVPDLIEREAKWGRKPRRQPVFVEHHLSHAASCFLMSPFDEAAILTVDGMGEWATTTCGTGRGASIALDHEIRYPHSLGLLYSTMTAHLGFRVNNGEGKVMGLAAYGQPTYLDALRQVVQVEGDGSFRLDMRYFVFHRAMRMPSRRWRRLFGVPRQPESELTQRHFDLAASLQAFLEDVLLAITRHLHERYRLPDLCLAGGVSLNCVANGRIIRETPFERIFVQPGAGDSGTAVGAAAYAHAQLLGGGRPAPMTDAYLGPAFTDADCERALKEKDIPYRRLPEPDLQEHVAARLAEGRIIGWYQGRMEFGPRALGNRSILANPCRAEMKDILNDRVKHREWFRPFAPAILAEERERYFDLPVESPYMLLAGPVHGDKQALVPAITHVDGTARVQTVAREQNPRYYDLIAAFGRRTGVPVLLNTSFNVRGEPIVCTPAEALSCFLRTDMDDLVLHNFVVDKREVAG